jgi:hypothetical protein
VAIQLTRLGIRHSGNSRWIAASARGEPTRNGRKGMRWQVALGRSIHSLIHYSLLTTCYSLIGLKFGPIRVRRNSGLAQLGFAAVAYFVTNSSLAPICARSGVHSGERTLAINA